jgi:hypothetical protein
VANQKYTYPNNVITNGVSPDENQDEENAEGLGVVNRRWNNRVFGRHSHVSISSGPISDSALGLNDWREHPANHPYHRYGLHGGLVRFFIERRNRPKLIYLRSSSRILELRFMNEKGQAMKKNANILRLDVGNDGNSDALHPTIGVVFKADPQKKLEWSSAFFIDSEAKGLEFREILVKTETDLESISESELAYALVTNGLRQADTLMKTTSSAFIIAFAFQETKQFYFATENIVPLELGVMKLDLTGHASNMPARYLSSDYNFLLTARAWNDIGFVTTEEEL